MADQVGGTARPVRPVAGPVAPAPAPARAPAPAPSSTNGQGLVPQEWPSQITDTIVDTVGKVRDSTAGPATKAAHAVVFGLLAALLATIAVVLLLILLIRLGANYVPGPLWIVYLVLGALFTIGGVVLWVRAFRAPAES